MTSGAVRILRVNILPVGLALALLLCPACTQQAAPSSSTPQAAYSQLPAELCFLDEIAPEIKVDLMYAGHDNFVGRPIDGYTGKRAVLRRDAARALAAASRDLASRGYTILLRDAYRPHRALADIAAWAKTPEQSMKQKYFPRISKAQIHGDRYIGDLSEHSFGIAVDITLLDAQTGQPIDMGSPIDFLDPSSATRYQGSFISAEAKKNRALLLAVMQRHGFKNYEKEWWHYYLGKESAPWLLHNFPLNDRMTSTR